MTLALVTGAASGIGRATAARLAAEGFDVVGVDRTPGDGITAVDLTDPAATTEALARVGTDHGPVGVLVHAAGVPGTAPFLSIPEPDWDRVLDIHLGALVRLTRLVLPQMLAARQGRIVTVLTDGLWHGRTSVAYTTAKGAVLGFTRSLAVEVAGQGVRVNAIAPGPVDTPMLRADGQAALEAELATVPIGRALGPEEVAATIAFLVSPAGDAYVGQVLSPNGGTVFPA